MSQSVEINPQLLALSTLIQLEQQARRADSQEALAFMIANDTQRLAPYAQAVVYRINAAKKVQIITVSGVSQIDKNAPFIQWLKQLITQEFIKNEEALALCTRDQLAADLQTDTATFQYFLHTAFKHEKTTPQAGVLFLRNEAWTTGERTLIERITDAYSHAWYALSQRRFHRSETRPVYKLLMSGLLIAATLSLFIPVHESVLAPAEIIAESPLVVSSPAEGTVQTIHVTPNQQVKAGQTLFSLDDTVQKNRYEIAKKSLAVAEADLLRGQQKAFTDRQSKAELALLRAKVTEKQAELNYVADLLARLEVKAERAGIALFTDANDWLGKPVAVGEKVMVLAQPDKTEVQLWVSVADAINLSLGTEVTLFLNTDPTTPLYANLYQASYEAELTPDNTLAFRTKAKLSESTILPRIGLKGTGKIYGKEVPLYYYLFRRPWSTVRQYLGI